MRSEYIRGVTSDAMLEQVRLLTEANGEAWMTEERQDGKSLIDSGCNRHMFGNRELFQDFVETLIPIKTADNTIYAMGVGTVGKH